MSILSRMIAWVEKAKYWLSRECCYDEMEEKGYASQGRCCGLMGGDNWTIRCICVLTARTTHRLLEGKMKRLTEYTIPETGFSVVSEEKYKRIMMEEKPSVEKVYNRLKKIEDILGDEYDLDELKEVVQAKREGRCMVLPCKIGDTLYRIQRFKRGKNRRKEAEFIRTVELNRNNFWRIVMDGEIGKTVFLTRAEAEAALRREQDGNNK